MTCTILIFDRNRACNVNFCFVSVHTVAIILNNFLFITNVTWKYYFRFISNSVDASNISTRITLLFAFSKFPLAPVPTLPSVRWWSRGAVPFASVPLVLTFIFAVVGWNSGHHHEANNQQDDQKLGLQQYGSEIDLIHGRSSS